VKQIAGIPQVKTTSSAVKGCLSCQVTPFLGFQVTDLPSAPRVLSSRPGTVSASRRRRLPWRQNKQTSRAGCLEALDGVPFPVPRPSPLHEDAESDVVDLNFAH
jgi:hypothetical protein